MNQSTSIENINEIILNTLNYKTNEYKNMLDYFNIQENNFSKSLRIELDEFSKEIKSNKNIFTSVERENLMFLCANNNSDSAKDKMLTDKLKILKLNLENLNLKLKISCRNNKLTDNEIKIEKNSNFEYLLSKILKIIDCADQNQIYSIDLNSENNSEIKLVDELENEIIQLNEENKILNMEKLKLEKCLESYCNLPSDINRIKEMIKNKRDELSKFSELSEI